MAENDTIEELDNDENGAGSSDGSNGADELSGDASQASYSSEPGVEGAKRRRVFRMRGKVFFLTWPRCDLEPNVVAGILRTRVEKEFVGVRVAQELHKDGGKHLHAVLITTGRQVCSPTFFDLGNVHGNYQIARSIGRTAEYVSKFGNFVDEGDVSKLTHFIRVNAAEQRKAGKSSGVTKEIAEAIDKGATLADITKKHPGFVLMNRRKIEEYISLSRELQITNVELAWPTADNLNAAVENALLTGMDMQMAGMRPLISWLRDNLASLRAFKTPQLYIWGPPNSGKTSLTQFLSKFFRTYWAPMDESFFDHFQDEIHDLIIFDEFYGQHKITFMNQFLQGGPMTIRKKGSQGIKRRNQPVIITANVAPTSLYQSCPAEIRAGFESRLQSIELVEPIFPLIGFLQSVVANVENAQEIASE